MICATCLALEFAPEDSLRALVRYQAAALDRLLGGSYVQPTPAELAATPSEFRPPREVLSTVEGLLSHEDIWRKPARVAAPRLVERLALAGLTITQEQP